MVYVYENKLIYKCLRAEDDELEVTDESLCASSWNTNVFEFHGMSLCSQNSQTN